MSLDIDQYDLIVFDLDGTLVDSVPDLCLALNESLEICGYARVPEVQVRAWVGNGSLKLVTRALASLSIDGESVIKQVHEQFLTSYESYLCVRSQLYPFVKETLLQLKKRNKTLVVLTNKPIKFVPELLRKLGIGSYFSAVYGGDSFAEKKPHPMPLLHILNESSIIAERCLMVGDSRSDILCANEAKTDSVALMQGYHQGVDLAALSPSYLFEDMEQFYKCAFRLT